MAISMPCCSLVAVVKRWRELSRPVLSVNKCHDHSQEKTSSLGGKQGAKDVNGANLDLRGRNLAFSTAWLSPIHASSSDKHANSKGFIFKRRLHDQRTCDYRTTKSGTAGFGSLGVVLLVHERKKKHIVQRL